MFIPISVLVYGGIGALIIFSAIGYLIGLEFYFRGWHNGFRESGIIYGDYVAEVKHIFKDHIKNLRM